MEVERISDDEIKDQIKQMYQIISEDDLELCRFNIDEAINALRDGDLFKFIDDIFKQAEVKNKGGQPLNGPPHRQKPKAPGHA